ncbi:MFS transporter, partial [bacterium]|nr:MFS transporter [bacterium]
MRYPKYRWVILGMAWLVSMCLGWSQFLVPSLAYCLFSDLSLTHAQFTLIFTAPTVVAIFSSY